MTPTITALNGRPTAARDRHVTYVFVGRSKKWANLTTFVLFRSAK